MERDAPCTRPLPFTRESDEYVLEEDKDAGSYRWMAIEAVGKLPDLFETLTKRSRETVTKLQARKKEADALSEAIEAILPETTEQVNALKKGKK